ncbi:hypothetical protein D9M70_451350 [compost metagenome]
MNRRPLDCKPKVLLSARATRGHHQLRAANDRFQSPAADLGGAIAIRLRQAKRPLYCMDIQVSGSSCVPKCSAGGKTGGCCTGGEGVASPLFLGRLEFKVRSNQLRDDLRRKRGWIAASTRM